MAATAVVAEDLWTPWKPVRMGKGIEIHLDGHVPVRVPEDRNPGQGRCGRPEPGRRPSRAHSFVLR